MREWRVFRREHNPHNGWAYNCDDSMTNRRIWRPIEQHDHNRRNGPGYGTNSARVIVVYVDGQPEEVES